jgi:hypothetical protein
VELIPTNRSLSNQTGALPPSPFVAWGPDLTDQEGVTSDGTYHVQGPVLVNDEDYTIGVSIVAIDNGI